jgi:ABC-type sugar transport system substrate-binding protein
MKKTYASLAALVLAGGLSACGSGDEGGEGGGGGGGKLPSAGIVGIILSDASSEVENRWAETATTAMEKIGWGVEIVDGSNDPAAYQQAMTSFINKNVAGIITVAIDAPAITTTLRDAQDADVPVIAAGIRIDPSGSELFSGSYAPDDAELGRVTAEYMQDKLKEGDDYVVLDLTAVYGAHQPVVAAQPLFDEAGFELVGTHDISVQDIIGSAQKGAVDLMTANPDAKFMFGCCDFTAALTVPALADAGFPDVIQTVRYDNLSTLDLIREGAPVATAATDSDRGMLTALDQILAHAADGTEVDPDAKVGEYQYEMVDAENVPAKGEFFYDPAPVIEEFVGQWKSDYGL